jgi:hypothetical protein
MPVHCLPLDLDLAVTTPPSPIEHRPSSPPAPRLLISLDRCPAMLCPVSDACASQALLRHTRCCQYQSGMRPIPPVCGPHLPICLPCTLAPPADVPPGPGQGSGPENRLVACACAGRDDTCCQSAVSMRPQEIELPSPRPLFPSPSGPGRLAMGTWGAGRLAESSESSECGSRPAPHARHWRLPSGLISQPRGRPRRSPRASTPAPEREILHRTGAAVARYGNETSLSTTAAPTQVHAVPCGEGGSGHGHG